MEKIYEFGNKRIKIRTSGEMLKFTDEIEDEILFSFPKTSIDSLKEETEGITWGLSFLDKHKRRVRYYYPKKIRDGIIKIIKENV